MKNNEKDVLELDKFKKSRKEIEKLYSDMAEEVKMNPQLYIMPVEMYNARMKKMGHMIDRIKSQTKSLLVHISDKKILRHKIKDLEKEIKKLKGELNKE